MTNLILVSGSYSTGAAWRPVMKHLPHDWTIKTVTLPGYDDVPDPRQRDACSVELLAPSVTSVAADMTGPIHLAGHSFGFQPIVAAAANGHIAPASMTSFEGNILFPLKRTGQTDLFRQACAIRDRFIEAHDQGDPDAAGIIIDYWGNPGAWQAMPDEIKTFVRAGATTNTMDWIGACEFAFDFEVLANSAPKIGIVRGEYANAAMVGICDACSQFLPQATYETVAGANHFLITTHPKECASILLDVVQSG